MNTCILFLDFDGVINSEAYFEEIGTSHAEINKEYEALGDMNGPESFELRLKCLDRIAILRVNRILKATNAKVVLSTNWARMIEPEVLTDLLEAKGFEGDILGRTPRKFSMFLREKEIRGWLEAHPETEHFVILEDYEELGELEKHTVRTDPKTGLLDEHVEQAVALLALPREAGT